MKFSGLFVNRIKVKSVKSMIFSKSIWLPSENEKDIAAILKLQHLMLNSQFIFN